MSLHGMAAAALAFGNLDALSLALARSLCRTSFGLTASAWLSEHCGEIGCSALMALACYGIEWGVQERARGNRCLCVGAALGRVGLSVALMLLRGLAAPLWPGPDGPMLAAICGGIAVVHAAALIRPRRSGGGHLAGTCRSLHGHFGPMVLMGIIGMGSPVAMALLVGLMLGGSLLHTSMRHLVNAGIVGSLGALLVIGA